MIACHVVLVRPSCFPCGVCVLLGEGSPRLAHGRNVASGVILSDGIACLAILSVGRPALVGTNQWSTRILTLPRSPSCPSTSPLKPCGPCEPLRHVKKSSSYQILHARLYRHTLHGVVHASGV